MALSIATCRQGNDPEPVPSIRVLLLDTPENLGIDFLQNLQKEELKLLFERVNDKEGLNKALKKGTWDLLMVSDQVNVPHPDEALDCLRKHDCETRFVLLSKAPVNMDQLTLAYRKGIAAVVSAGNPEYSLEVFAREAENSRRNFQLSQLNQEKFQLKRLSQQLMSGTEEALAYLQDGIHVFSNDAYARLLGYPDPEALQMTPFIDIVSTEMRDKSKQMLLDYQHKVRMSTETPPLEVAELFVNGIGEREGVLQVGAMFKPVVYDGEDCIQVIFRSGQAAQVREEAGATEGLGYPLFVTHLDNFIAQAHAAGKTLGHVVHIHAKNTEHYMAVRGFGSLSGKFRVLASELKSLLARDELQIRFTENSFLLLLREREGQDQGCSKLAELEKLLNMVAAALNREAGTSEENRTALVCDVIPVDAGSLPAEQLLRNLLMNRAAGSEPPLAGHAPVMKQDNQTVIPAANQSSAASVPAGTDVPAESPGVEATERPVGTGPQVDQASLNAALNGNHLSLMYEAVISVGEIATELYDVNAYLPAGDDTDPLLLSRTTLDEAARNSPVAGKLDQWVLQNTFRVIAELYSQGQECPVHIKLGVRSLSGKNFPESVARMLKDAGLPAAMLVLGFSLEELNADPAGNAERLEKLRAAGIAVAVTDVTRIGELKELLRHAKVDLIRMQGALLGKAASDEKFFDALQQSVRKLQDMKTRVMACDIHSSNELSVCCRAGIDLVKGHYIQKQPRLLDADTLAEALMV